MKNLPVDSDGYDFRSRSYLWRENEEEKNPVFKTMFKELWEGARGESEERGIRTNSWWDEWF